MARKKVVVPILIFLAMLAVPPAIYPDHWQYSWWLLYEAVIHDRHYDRCIWRSDIINGNATILYDFEYDAELDCHVKDRPRGD